MNTPVSEKRQSDARGLSRRVSASIRRTLGAPHNTEVAALPPNTPGNPHQEADARGVKLGDATEVDVDRSPGRPLDERRPGTPHGAMPEHQASECHNHRAPTSGA